MNKAKTGVVSLFLASTLLLSGCDVALAELTLDDVLKGIFEVRGSEEEDGKSLDEHIYSKYKRDNEVRMTRDLEKRFGYKIKSYKGIVGQLWNTEGFYRSTAKSTEKEALIDFYLFMEYHKDTQKRNLQFPEFLQDDLLLVEAMFANRAIHYIENREFKNKKFRILRDDLVTLNKGLYREEVLNILYEGHQQVDLLIRIPNIIDRNNAEMKNIGIRKRLKTLLGIPDSVISRGMGIDLVTLYTETDQDETFDKQHMAIMLAMEMKLSGINMRLERFFHVTNSLKGVSTELRELRRDVKTLNPSGEFGWVRARMLRSIDHLENVHAFYRGKKPMKSVNQIFIDLKTREDFYALNLLSEHLQVVMDREDYWDEVDEVRAILEKRRGR